MPSQDPVSWVVQRSCRNSLNGRRWFWFFIILSYAHSTILVPQKWFSSDHMLLVSISPAHLTSQLWTKSYHETPYLKKKPENLQMEDSTPSKKQGMKPNIPTSCSPRARMMIPFNGSCTPGGAPAFHLRQGEAPNESSAFKASITIVTYSMCIYIYIDIYIYTYIWAYIFLLCMMCICLQSKWYQIIVIVYTLLRFIGLLFLAI